MFTSDMEFTEGTWSNGKLNGYGVRKYATGDEYRGTWVEDQLEGEGQFKTKEGDLYKGAFHMSMEHGFGYRWYGTTRCEYSGDW